MSLSYYVGLDACLVFGSSCCANTSIDLDNENMRRILEYTGFPSISSMAEQDAYTVVTQWQRMYPEYFLSWSKRRKFIRKQNGRLLERAVHQKYERKLKKRSLDSNSELSLEVDKIRFKRPSLLFDLFELAKKWEEKSKHSKSKEIPDMEKRCNQARKNLGNDFTYAKWWSVISMYSMRDFKCLEAFDLLHNNKVPLQLTTHYDNNEWKYVTHKRKRKVGHADNDSWELEPIRIKVGKFAVLEPIENCSVPEIQIDNSEVLKDNVSKRVGEKTKKRKRSKKKKGGKKAADELDYTLRGFSATSERDEPIGRGFSNSTRVHLGDVTSHKPNWSKKTANSTQKIAVLYCSVLYC